MSEQSGALMRTFLLKQNSLCQHRNNATVLLSILSTSFVLRATLLSFMGFTQSLLCLPNPCLLRKRATQLTTKRESL